MATLTVYPDKHTESTSVDGHIAHSYLIGSGQSWATLRAALGNVAVDNAASADIVAFIADTSSDEWRYLLRSIFLFDTSALPSNANISNAVLSIYGNSKSNTLGLSGTNFKINIYASAPASEVALENGDFNSLLTTPLSDTDITYDDFDITGYNAFTLNASGIALISKTGRTKFGIREAYFDVAGNTPTWASGRPVTVLNAYFADQPGTNKDPKLVITYTVGTAPIVTTQAVSDIATSTATGNGNVTDLGDTVTQHGHCWNTTGTPTTSDNKTENGIKATTGAFTSGLSKLIPSTVYRVRAYATNSIGTSYGNEVSFSTTSGASGTGGGVGGVSGVPPATGISFPVGERLLKEEGVISAPMPEMPMTDIEALVYQWLTRKGIEFQFQTSLMGGFYQLGGAVVDFLLPARNLAWRIFGEYWHRGVQKEGSDVLQKETLAAMGWTVVDLWSDDILNRLEQTLTKALRGEEILR